MGKRYVIKNKTKDSFLRDFVIQSAIFKNNLVDLYETKNDEKALFFNDEKDVKTVLERIKNKYKDDEFEIVLYNNKK